MLVAACDQSAPERDRSTPSLSSCGSGAETSRWAPEPGHYVRVGEYGRKLGQEFADIWGVAATPNGSVLVWDAGNTRIVSLNGSLEVDRTMGRMGEGPGEFAYQRVPHGRWIASGDSSLIVLGLTKGFFTEFGFDGRFLQSPTRAPPYPFSIRDLALIDGHILYSVDNITQATGIRVLETWRLERELPHTLMRQDTMPTLPIWRGRPLEGGLIFPQANPLWAVDHGCFYVSDGGSTILVRVNPEDSQVDSVELPAVQPPERRRDDFQRIERALDQARAWGLSATKPDVEPSLRVRWAKLVVDPDGFLWLAPWRPPSYSDEPIDAVLVDPRTGRTKTVRVPRFPAAFLPGGRFVAVGLDEATGVPFIEQFEAVTLKGPDP